MGFKTYSQLYNSCVVPVLHCCSGAWGFKSFDKIDMIQNRATRYFMGVHRFTPILAITGQFQRAGVGQISYVCGIGLSIWMKIG